MQSDSKHIVQEKYRAVLCLFRKSRRWLESFKEGTSLINALDSQRIILRSSEEEIDAHSILSPFLTILRTPQLSGPFITLSLDAIHTFVSCNIIIKGSSGISDTLGDVIDAVSRCRFVQTDSVGDQLVQLKIIQVLQDIVRCPLRSYLSDESAWDIVDASFSLMLSLGNKRMKSGLYQMTEQTLMDTVRFIFAATYKSEFGTVTSSFPNDELHEIEPGHTSTPVSFGMPCAMKVLGYFVNIIQKYANETTTTAPPKLNRNSSNPNNSASDDMLPFDQDIQELVIALKALQSILWSDGNTRNARDIILRCPPMASLIRDDLSRCLILLAGKRGYPAVVFQNILGLFSTLYTSFGPALKVLIECFTIYVFLKSLHQMSNLLGTQDEIQSGVRSPRPNPPGSPNSVSPQSSNQFSVEELEMIFDCLLDFIAIPGFIPSLYASFDCDATKPDAVKPLFQYLGKCASYFLSTPNDSSSPGPNRHTLGPLYNSALMIVQCLLQISQTTAQRCLESSLEISRRNYWESHSEKYAGLLDTSPQYTPDRVAAKLRADMMTKMLLREAAVKFVDKPKLCFQFLQEHGALDNPVTAFSVAKFLRICPGLPKDAVGAFLGENGKDKPDYEWDTKDFHKDVLFHYVRSFQLTNQGILNCLRIFLSAFRLPGEAQQIDRILVAFSEHCHSCCPEGQSGLLQNSEVAYLLTFAIIMLNTDRHNPSVRADRKMTMEQFIKYNTNYGSDVNQTRDIPREFLESIYTEISNLPLRTEKNDVSATLTPEMWLDLQLQAQMNPEQGFLITTVCPPDIMNHLRACSVGLGSTGEDNRQAVTEELFPSKPRRSTHQTYENTYILLTTRIAQDPIKISSCVYGSHWIADAGLVDCLWMPLISAAMSPFIRQEIPSPPPASGEKPKRIILPAVTEACLSTGKELFLLAVKLCYTYNLSVVVDAVVLLLADFAGLAKGEMIDAMVKTLMPLGPLSIELNAGIAHMHESIPLNPEITQKLELQRQVQLAQETSFTYRVSTEFMASLMTFTPAMTALQCLLQIVVKYPNYLGSAGWLTIWHTLSILRDITVLPIELVCGEDDTDLLHPKAREDYEYRMASTRCQELMLQREEKLVARIKQLTKTSVLSFQGLGEVLFGASSSGQPTETEILLRKEMETTASYEGMQSVQSGRWNAGYPVDPKSASDLRDYVDYIDFQSNSLPADLPDYDDYDDYIQILGRITVLKLRKMMIDENIIQIISDSKFLEEKCILLYFQQLCHVMESKRQSKITSELTLQSNCPLDPGDEPAPSVGGHGIEDLKHYLVEVSKKLPPPTEASSAWLEMVLVEATLRNRDRLSLIWPMISTHYSRPFFEDESILASVQHSEGHPVILSHSIDRRVCGVFKIATRMLSRQQLCNPIINLLYSVFGQVSNEHNKSKSAPVRLNLRKDSFCNPDTSSPPMDVDLRDYILFEISGQIASGMWIMLTQNVLILPNLRLEQWQYLFDVISMAARGGGYAAMKSFECMAWLIHEPSLRAEVPVFCVQAIRPLLSNPSAPYSVATGAINLLLHLHSRLEVLVRDENSHPDRRIIDGEIVTTASHQTDGLESNSDVNGETPALWESCWVPILQAISDGIHDKRLSVKRCAVDALCWAISDKHAAAVPIEVLSTVLHDIMMPAATWLGNDLVQTVSNGTYSSSLAIPEETTSDYKIRAEFYQNVLDQQANSSPKPKSLKQGVTADLLTTLCKVFLVHMNRLVTCPSFEELWKLLLGILTFYLDAPPPMGNGFETKLCKLCVEIQQTVDIALELLKNVILVMSSSGHFTGTGKKGQLWIITRQATGNLIRSPDLLTELFPTVENKQSST